MSKLTDLSRAVARLTLLEQRFNAGHAVDIGKLHDARNDVIKFAKASAPEIEAVKSIPERARQMASADFGQRRMEVIA